MTTLEDILSKVEDTISTAQDLTEIVDSATPEIGLKIVQAEADPTSANVQAVLTAYANAGQVPPVKLAAHLILINEERHPEDTVRGNAAPFVLGAAALAIWLFSRKGR